MSRASGPRYGKLPSIDNKIGNMYTLHANPGKRYFTITTARGKKNFFPNLPTARKAVMSKGNNLRKVFTIDLNEELESRTTKQQRLALSVPVSVTIVRDEATGKRFRLIPID